MQMTRTYLLNSVWRITIWCLCLLPVSAWCGNRAMVENRVRELSELNQQLLDQEPEIPKTGKILLKAHVYYGDDGTIDLRVYSRKFSTISEEPIQLEGNSTQLLSN